MIDVPRFLSDEWIAEFDRVASTADALRLPEGSELVVEQTVTEVPGAETADGTVAYHLRLSDGPTTVRPGPAADPTVTFTQSYATATAIARGTASAQAEFMSGRLRIGGRVDELIAHGTSLSGLDGVLADLAASTQYDDPTADTTVADSGA